MLTARLLNKLTQEVDDYFGLKNLGWWLHQRTVHGDGPNVIPALLDLACIDLTSALGVADERVTILALSL